MCRLLQAVACAGAIAVDNSRQRSLKVRGDGYEALPGSEEAGEEAEVKGQAKETEHTWWVSRMCACFEQMRVRDV